MRKLLDEKSGADLYQAAKLHPRSIAGQTALNAWFPSRRSVLECWRWHERGPAGIAH
jgi:hypothetical protein